MPNDTRNVRVNLTNDETHEVVTALRAVDASDELVHLFIGAAFDQIDRETVEHKQRIARGSAALDALMSGDHDSDRHAFIARLDARSAA